MKKIAALICTVLACGLLLSGCGLEGAAKKLVSKGESAAEHVEEYVEGEKLIGYSVGNAEILDTVENLDVDWASGKVDVVYHEGDSILLTEEYDGELSEERQMHWKLEGRTLHVRFSDGRTQLVSFGTYTKRLTVTLPEGFRAKDIELSVASAAVNTEKLFADSIDVDSASGNVTLSAEATHQLQVETASGAIDVKQYGSVQTLSLQSASGAINAELESVEELDAVSSSGKITVSADTLAEAETETSSGKVDLTVRKYMGVCGISTASGRVDLTLPETLGFTAEVDTASGEFESEIALKYSGDRYVAGDGIGEIEIETSSGDITIHAL